MRLRAHIRFFPTRGAVSPCPTYPFSRFCACWKKAQVGNMNIYKRAKVPGNKKVTLCVALARGLSSRDLPHNPRSMLKPTATQGPAWPRPVRSSTQALKPTWNTGFLQGQGQRTGLRPSESVGMRAKQSLLISPPHHLLLLCLQQDAFFNIYRYFWLSPRSSYNKREPQNLARSQPDPHWQVGLLWLCRKHLAQRPRHLPFPGPDGDPHFLSSGHFPTLTGGRGGRSMAPFLRQKLPLEKQGLPFCEGWRRFPNREDGEIRAVLFMMAT